MKPREAMVPDSGQFNPHPHHYPNLIILIHYLFRQMEWILYGFG